MTSLIVTQWDDGVKVVVSAGRVYLHIVGKVPGASSQVELSRDEVAMLAFDARHVRVFA